MRKTLVGLALVAIAYTPAAHAQVQEANDEGFVIERSVQLPVSGADAWETFTQISEWWHPDHTYTMEASRLSMTAEPGGCFCESLPGGGFVEHMRIVYADPGVMVRMAGGLGPLQDQAVSGAMTWTFEDNEDGTLLTLRYRVAGIAAGGLSNWAVPVDGVLAQQLERLGARFDSAAR